MCLKKVSVHRGTHIGDLKAGIGQGIVDSSSAGPPQNDIANAVVILRERQAASYG
jgi:hypothetical protein